MQPTNFSVFFLPHFTMTNPHVMEKALWGMGMTVFWML